MTVRFLMLAVILGYADFASSLHNTRGEEPDSIASSAENRPRQNARRAIKQGLVFLKNDAAKWRQEHKCSTCHHGTMTVWVFAEAKRQGYSVKAEIVKETTEWTRKRILDRIDKPRDSRPGWKMVNTPAIYLALMARFVATQDSVSAGELERIASHLIRHQEADGSWAWSSAPPTNRPPPFFESDEVATRLAYLALARHVPADLKKDSAARNSRKNAAAWLRKTKHADTTQAAALRLLMKSQAAEEANSVPTEIATFLKRQNKDGGWGQLRDLSSDPYATGQALYVLAIAGVKSDRPEIQRAVAFLVANQRKDGSWPMKSRAHAGARPYKNPVPITYFGSAWATLGLMRSVPHMR